MSYRRWNVLAWSLLGIAAGCAVTSLAAAIYDWPPVGLAAAVGFGPVVALGLRTNHKAFRVGIREAIDRFEDDCERILAETKSEQVR
jgi:hypothetical protein